MTETLEDAERATFAAAVNSYENSTTRAACTICDDSGLIYMVIGLRAETDAERERRIEAGGDAPKMQILNKSEIRRYSYLARNAGPCPNCREGELQRTAAENRGRDRRFRLTRDAIRRHLDTHFYVSRPAPGTLTTEKFIEQCRQVDGH